MQFQLIQEKKPHYHRIDAVSYNGEHFYFRDDGVLFLGVDEWEAVEVQATLGKPTHILFEDLQDAFRLGIVVATLRSLEHSECENNDN